MIYRIFLIVLIPFAYYSCLKNNIKEKTENNMLQSNEVKEIFEPDIHINNLELVNPESIIKNIGNLKSDVVEDENLPHVTFFNNDKTQKLQLILFPGSGYNDVYQFKIEYNTTSILNNINILKDSLFISESGITLGITKSKLIEIKGKGYIRNEDDIVQYQITESESPQFLKKFNLPLYYAKYVFVEDKLDKFEFGFEYP